MEKAAKAAVQIPLANPGNSTTTPGLFTDYLSVTFRKAAIGQEVFLGPDVLLATC